MRNDTLIISGEPDTRRRVSPVPREGLGDLSSSDDKAPLPYPTLIACTMFSTNLGP